MAERRYLDFELAIEEMGEGQYRARVLESPAGEARATFTFPLSPLELENFVLRLSQTRTRRRRLESSEREAARIFGARLFDAVFVDEVGTCLRRSIDEAERSAQGLRIRLRLSDAPSLAGVPWEYLYSTSNDRFLVLSSWTPLVRYLDLPRGVTPLRASPPLRVLVMVSSPTDYPALDTDAEWQRLHDGLADLIEAGLVELHRLDDASLTTLQRALLLREYHILHFIGHGGFDEPSGDGVLMLEEASGRARVVPGRDLGTILHDHRSLRLTVLNACEGARASSADPFSGSAQSLLRAGIPAVVAMQFEISDDAAIAFAHAFYGALAVGLPVDASVTEARKAVFGQGDSAEWGTPVVYMRSPDGQIFDLPAPDLTRAPAALVDLPAAEPLPDIPSGDAVRLPDEADLEAEPAPPDLVEAEPMPTGVDEEEPEPAPADREVEVTPGPRRVSEQPRPARHTTVEEPIVAAPPLDALDRGTEETWSAPEDEQLLVAHREHRSWLQRPRVRVIGVGAGAVLLGGALVMALNMGPGADDPVDSPRITAATSTPNESALLSPSGVPRSVRSDDPTVTAYRLSDFRADGDLREWAAFEAHTTTPFQVFTSSQANWDGSDDVESQWWLGWDDEYLYIAVSVTDDMHNQPSTGNQIYRGDAVDIHLGLDVPGATRPDGDDFQVILSPGDFADSPPTHVVFQGDGEWFARDRMSPHIVVGAMQTATGYRIEGAIPWSELGLAGPPPAEGDGFPVRLLLSVFDNDGEFEAASGRVAQTVVKSHVNGGFQRPQEWGYLALAD